MTDLGPTTERRFADAFATKAVITAQAAAALIGLDEKTLAALSDQQVIRSVPKGKLRAYTERDLRAYLTEGPDACRTANPKRAASAAPTATVVAFTALQPRQRNDPQRRGTSRSVRTSKGLAGR